MGLKEYHRKRDFGKTPEPAGTERPDGDGNSFVVQKHAATRLHYDFRLEMEGVLRSWAVPKGPSLDPADKRLAMETEDHPLEYGGFEGIIPRGEYGGGTVIVWDRGTWTCEGDPVAGWRAGKLTFTLEGEKLRGQWHMFRMRGSSAARARGRAGREDDDDERAWMLVKRQDAEARPAGEYDVAAERPESVLSGRVLEEVASDADQVWHSNRPASSRGRGIRQRLAAEIREARASGEAPAPRTRRRSTAASGAPAGAGKAEPARASAGRSAAGGQGSGAAARSGARASVAQIPGATRGSLPDAIDPQLCTLVTAAPEGDDWIHEVKLDGYRAFAFADAGEVRFISRNGKDWTASFGPLPHAVASLPFASAVLDGEVCVHETAPDRRGLTSFQALQQALGAGRTDALVYHVFDVLHLDGQDLRRVPLVERKSALADLLDGAGQEGAIRYVDHVAGGGRKVHAEACRLGLEGIVSKRPACPHRPGRGKDWLKIRCQQRQEVVVGGWTEPSGARSELGALLVGTYEGGDLVFAGKVGTGFTERTLRDLRRRLKPLERATPPFANPPRGAAARGVHWVEPELVVEVEFTNWTDEGALRHPSYEGIREDKPARDVVRERPRDVTKGGDGGRVTKRAEPSPKSRRRPAATARPPAATEAEAGGIEPTAERRHPRNPRGPRPADSGRAKPTLRQRLAAEAREAAAARGKALPAARARTTAKRSKDDAEVAGVRISNPARVLYPSVGLTKLDLARYYEAMAGLILPHVASRPLTLVRCPEGEQGECFFQKHAVAGLDPAVRRVPIAESKGTKDYLYVEDLRGLVSFVQMGTLEFHAWGSRVPDYEKPDLLVFDLDPDPEVGWDRVVASGAVVRDTLEAIGLRSYLKTTGGKGLHVCVPLVPRVEWDQAKAFTLAVAESIAREHPGEYVTVLSKEKRKGRIFLDYLRNGRGATAVCAWSTRARPGATVSMPLPWSALSTDLRPGDYTVLTVPGIVGARGWKDPWAGFLEPRQSLTKAILESVE